MESYCTDDDVFTLALAAQAFVVRPRPVAAADIDAATGTIRLKAHGLTVDDLVGFEVTAGGSLPTGVTAFTPYYPAIISFDLIKLSASLGGPVLTYVSGGSGWGLVVDPRRRIALHRKQTAALINQHLTAYNAPIPVDPVTGEYPPVLVGLNARMTARAAVTSLQVENPAHRAAVDRLFAQEEFDKLMLDRLSRDGWTVNPPPAAATPGNLAISRSASSSSSWGCGGSLP